MRREIRYREALREARRRRCSRPTREAISSGSAFPVQARIFGTTKGLREEFGDQRVLDMPSSENAMTGIALGTSLLGRRPIMVHMRFDFAVLSMEPCFMFDSNFENKSS